MKGGFTVEMQLPVVTNVGANLVADKATASIKVVNAVPMYDAQFNKFVHVGGLVVVNPAPDSSPPSTPSDFKIGKG